MVTLASFRQTKGWTTAPSFFSLLLIITAGVYFIISVNDLVLLLAAWSLISVGAYALVAIKKDEASLEGASKYALMGVTASVFLMFGVFLLIGLTGTTTNLTTMAQVATAANLPLTLIAIIMIVVGIGFKIGIVPFHGWLPDVYGGVNSITISFVSTVLKVAGVLALFRILYPFAAVLGDKWLVLFSILSIATMTFGNIAALIQRNVQRMMAYSSIAQVGYILVGFAAATSGSGSGNRCSRDSPPPYRICFSYFRNFHCISLHNAKRHEDRPKWRWRDFGEKCRSYPLAWLFFFSA